VLTAIWKSWLYAGPDLKLKLSLNYPASVGRNMDEITRCIDALQLSAKYSVATPANCESSHITRFPDALFLQASRNLLDMHSSDIITAGLTGCNSGLKLCCDLLMYKQLPQSDASATFFLGADTAGSSKFESKDRKGCLKWLPALAAGGE